VDAREPYAGLRGVAAVNRRSFLRSMRRAQQALADVSASLDDNYFFAIPRYIATEVGLYGRSPATPYRDVYTYRQVAEALHKLEAEIVRELSS
jgi:hypothetical protein